MNIRNCQTALFVKDIEVSKKFYSEVLQLPVDLDFGKNIIYKAGFAIWEIRHDHMIPEKLGYQNLVNQSSVRFELYFETEEIDAVCLSLQEKGVNFLHDIHEEIWGQKTIRFFDPDNHLIEVGESMATFIGRFHNQGMTPEEISKRTFMPVEAVLGFLPHHE